MKGLFLAKLKYAKTVARFSSRIIAEIPVIILVAIGRKIKK